MDDTIEELLAGAHWGFSLRLYRREGVAPACLLLQDRCNLDVNVLLLGLYAATRLYVELSCSDIALLDGEVAEFRGAVIVPLRNARRQLKTMGLGQTAETIRNAIKSCELRAEQLEQAMIARWLMNAARATQIPDTLQVAQRITAHFAEKTGQASTLLADSGIRAAIELLASTAPKIGTQS